jgi:predicted CXXCH cytochrome family protein
MNFRSVSIRTLLLLPAALFVLSACTEDKLVEVPVDRPPFNPPADSINGFLGLYDVATNQTTCGNCHINNQGEWAQTAHADAYEGLVSSGGAQSFCFACHTVSANGNVAGLSGEPGGWDVVQSEAYRNVQCESCHGPGLAHVSNPTSTNIPLAYVTVADTAASCAACHNGTHHPYVEQWAESGHAIYDGATADSRGRRDGCRQCHNGRDAITYLTGGAPTNYVEENDGSFGFSITCAVCHDPHANTNAGQLRRPIDSQDQDANLCSTCHVRSATATPAFTINSRGAHASQGAVYFGEAAGWVPPGFTFNPDNPVYTAHLSRNQRLCAGCHVPNFTTTDAATGEEFTSVGHLFSPNPCKDANGLPTDGDCAYTATARFWTGCVGSGCHTNETEAAGLFNSEKTTIKLLLDNLWSDIDKDKVLDQTDGGVLAAVLRQRPTTVTPATDSTHFCCTGTTKDNSLSVAEGALFNARMLSDSLYDHNDGSYGIHNPALYEGLIAGSINAVRSRYGLAPSVVSPAAEAAIEKALSRQGIRYAPPAAVRQTATR